MKNSHKVIIIGSGPAGLTAAIYTARARLHPLVIAGSDHGGQLMKTSMVDNYPGFPEGIMGPELMDKMIKQAEKYGAEFVYQNVTKVDFSTNPKKLWTENQIYESKAVILAMGSSPRKLGIPREKEFWGRGVSTCAICDGAFFKDKTVAIVGGGNAAMEEASYITKFATKAYIIHRSDSFTASKIMQEKALSNKNIETIWNTEVKEITGDKTVASLKLFNNKDNTESTLNVDGLFLAIGHIPNTNFLKGHIELDDHGYIVVRDNTETSADGVFAAGDIRDYKYRQAVTAAGFGGMAAIDVEKWLNHQT